MKYYFWLIGFIVTLLLVIALVVRMITISTDESCKRIYGPNYEGRNAQYFTYCVGPEGDIKAI